MSGHSYGATQVTNAHQKDDDDADVIDKEENPLLPSSNSKVRAANESSDSKFSIGTQTDPSPLQTLWAGLTFGWISPLLKVGYDKGQLEVEDLESLPLPKDCETIEVYNVFLKYWEEELEKARLSKLDDKKEDKKKGDDTANGDTAAIDTDKDSEDEAEGLLEEQFKLDSTNSPHAYEPSLIRALYRAFGADFLRAGLLKLLHDSNLFVGPQVLNRLIQFLRNEDASLGYGFGLMFIVTCSQIIMSISLLNDLTILKTRIMIPCI